MIQWGHPFRAANRFGVMASALFLAACDLDSPGSSSPVASDPITVISTEKYRGVSLTSSSAFAASAIEDLQEVGVAWIAIVPVGRQPRFDVPEVRLRTTRGRWSRTDEGIRGTSARAHSAGMRVMVEPHIEFLEEVEGEWRGTIDFGTVGQWQQWEEDYLAFILHYARLAEELDIELFSVGSELQSVVRQRPAYWRQLISEVRKVYGGNMTYGANWLDEYEEVEFWDLLDFIGVHAYFPLTEKLNATAGDLATGWQPHVAALEAMSRARGKPILFTEVGYRSIAGAAIEPWNWRIQRPVDEEEQADAYEALFSVFWQRPWFAGLFLWEWDPVGSFDDADGYSPKLKPAADVMAQWFIRGADQPL